MCEETWGKNSHTLNSKLVNNDLRAIQMALVFLSAHVDSLNMHFSVLCQTIMPLLQQNKVVDKTATVDITRFL